MKSYINGIGCISAQKTFDSVFSEGLCYNKNENYFPVHAPQYKDYILQNASRRMAKGVKNGIVAATIALDDANESASERKPLDAIITGTGMGCIEDSGKFLGAIINNHEEFLTPTSFVQSTHNTVGAQVALGMQCKAYNFTYVNGAVSFESALMDAKLQMENDEASSLLVGGIDEMTDYTLSLFKLAGFIKEDNEQQYQVLHSQTKGVVFSEGATFFVLEADKKQSTYAEIIDVDICNHIPLDDLQVKAIEFLKKNELEVADIDAIVLGFNGDADFDSYYKELSDNAFVQIPQIYYKHLSGEYNTVSAFGLFVGANIIKAQQIPEIFKANSLSSPVYRKILLYNQYRGIDHSFTLISQC